MSRLVGDRAQTMLTFALIRQLVRKDLRVKYQGSTLGFLWSLANPLLQLVVYSVVFQFFMRSPIPQFGLFLMSGLLIWNFFSLAVSGASTSILANAGLVKKVPFAHSALPLASVGVAGIQMILQVAVFVAFLVVMGHAPWRPEVLLVLPATLVLVVLTVGLALFVSASTVRLRDTQHFIEVAMFAWMWLTPVIYPASFVHDQIPNNTLLYYLNPMAGIVVCFQRALYGLAVDGTTGKLLSASDSGSFYLGVLAISAAVSVAVFALGAWQFRRFSPDFAEDL